MTEKQLRRLHKKELLEVLYYLQKELEQVKEENKRLSVAVAAKGLSEEDWHRLETLIGASRGKVKKYDDTRP